jgi:integrase
LARQLDEQPPYGLLVRFMVYPDSGPVRSPGWTSLTWRPDGSTSTGRREKVKGGWREGTPKSEKSRRAVPMPGWLRADLRAYLAEQQPRGNDSDAPLWPGRHR